MMEGTKDDDSPQPRDKNGRQPKNDDGPQPKDDDVPQPKNNDGLQLKDSDGPQPKDDDVPQTENNDGPELKDNDWPQPKDEDVPQLKDNDGPQPRDDDVPQPRDDDGPQLKDKDGPQPKDEDDRPKPEDEDDGPQPKDEDDRPKPEDEDDGLQPKDDGRSEPKDDDGPQLKDNDGPQPRDDDVPQPRDDYVPQPKKDDGPQLKDNDGPQPKDEDDRPKPEDEDDGPQPKDDGRSEPKDDDGPQPKDDDWSKRKNDDGPKPEDEGNEPQPEDEGNEPQPEDEGNEPQSKDNDGPKPKDEGDEPEPMDEDDGPQTKDEDHKAICISTDNEDGEMPITESNANDIIKKIQGDGDSCKEPLDTKDDEIEGICVPVNKQDDDVPISSSDDSITANDPSYPITYRGGDHTIGSKISDLTDFEPQKCKTVGTDIENVGVDQSSEKCEALQNTSQENDSVCKSVRSEDQVLEADVNTSEMIPTEEKVNVCGDQVSVIGLEASSDETSGEKDQAEDRNKKNLLFEKVEEMRDHSVCEKGSAASGNQDVEPKNEVNSDTDDSSVMNISDTKQGSHFASLAEKADVILPARDAPGSLLRSEARSEKDTEHFESNTVAVPSSSLGSLSDESVEVSLRIEVDSKEALNDIAEKCDSKSDMNGAEKVDREMENHETSKKKVDVKNVIEDQLILTEENVSAEMQDPQMSKSCGFVKCATEDNGHDGGNVDADAVTTCLNEIICRVTESDAELGLCSEMVCHDEVSSEKTNESMATEASSIENLICASSNEMCGSQAFDTSHLESKHETSFVEGVASIPESVNETLISKQDEEGSSNNRASQSFDTTHLEKELESNVTPKHVADCPDVNEDEIEKEVFQANSNTGSCKTVDEVKMLSPLRSSKVCDTVGSNSPGFILSSPYTQTAEEYDALGHTSPDSQKIEKSCLGEDAEVSQVKMTDVIKNENDENSSEDEYGDASRMPKKRDKAKSPEKGNVFIGYSKRKNKFKCFLCDETGFGTSFEEHVMQHILWKPYKCLYCVGHQYFFTRSDIGKHVADDHKGKLPKCGLRAIKKAKEYMEYAKKDGTYQNFNNRLNDMYWSCKHKVSTVMSTENVNEPLYPEKSDDVQEESTSKGANIKTSDGADGSEESPVQCAPKTSYEMKLNGINGSEVTVVKESPTVSGVTESSGSDNNQDHQEIGPTGVKEPEVIQPRSLDFVAQLTKPQVSKLIAMYQDNGQTNVEEKQEQFPTVESTSKEISVDLIGVPASINVPTSSADLQKKAFPGSQGLPVAIPVYQNEQLPRYVSQNEGSVITEKSKLSSGAQQATPTFIHLLNSPPMGQQQVLPPAQQTGYPQNVKGQLSPPVVSQVLFPTLSPLFMNSNQQSPPNVLSIQPTTSDIIQKTIGNTQSVLTIPNVPQVASMNPVSMPLTIPSSTILTLIPSQQFVSSGRKILPAPCNSTPAVGQNTGCKLLFLQNVNSMTHLQSVSQQGKPTQEKPSENNSTTTRPHYPNILSKPKKQMNLAPVAEKNSQPIVSTKNLSHERLQRQSFSVGLINNDFVCCLCKGKYKHETSFRAHLWNHIHIERKPCSMCISSLNSSGRKTLACAKTEEYIEKLKSNKIGNTSHVDVVVPSLHKTATGVQRQEVLPQALFDKCQSILAAKSEQVSAAEMTIKQDKCSRNTETEKPATEKATLLVNTTGGVQSAISNLSASEKVTRLSSHNSGAAGILTNESGSKGTNRALSRGPSPVSNDHPVPVSAPSVSTSAVGDGNNQSILNESTLMNRVNRASFALTTQEPRDTNATVSKESMSLMRSTPASVCSDLSSVNSNVAASVSREFPVVKGNSAESVFRSPSPVSRDVSESVSGKPSSMNTRSTKWHFYVCGSGCGYSSLYGNELKKHVGECHLPNSMSCVHCLYYADGPDNLIRHMGKHYLAHAPGTAVHSCSVSGCKFTTNILQGFYQHIVSHPDIVNFECSNCRKTFPEVKLLMEHLQNNLLHVVNCRHCSAKDLVKAVIMSHISVTHPDKGRMAGMVKQLLCKDRKENQFILEQMQKSVPITSSKSEANKPELVSMDKPLPRKTDDMDDLDGSFELEIDRAASPIPDCDAKSTGFVESVTCPPSVDPVYDCGVCSYVGGNQKDLNTHTSKHAENPALKTLAFSCPECPEEFNLLNNFEMHLRKHSNILTYDICSCLICNMKTGSREDVEKHIRAMHEMVIGGGREFVDFKLKVSNSDVVKCNLCSYRCLGKELMERHNGKHHAKGVSQTIKTSCDERNSPYAPTLETNDSRKTESTAEKPKASSEVRVKMHIPSNSVFLNAVRCVKCNFSSVYKGNIQRHVKQFHPDVELVIDQRKSSPVKVGIQSSREVEPNDDSLKIGGRLLDTELEWLYENHGKSFKCMLCSKDVFFQRKNYLHSHILDHFGISLWKCALCDFKTSRRVVAVDHVKDVHHEQCDTDVIIPLVDEISTEVGHVLGKLVQGDMPVENIRPTLGSKELDGELRNKYKVIGKKKICKTCDVEHQSCYAIHSHIMRRHLKLFLFKCSYCNFSAVDRYSVAKHSSASHPHKEIIVKYEPASNKTQKKDKHLGNRRPSSLHEHSSRETQASTEKSVTAMSDSIHCFSGKQLHPHASETRNELRVGSDHLDQKLRPLYDVKQGREKLLICKTCEAAHSSKYTLHCDLLQHLGIKLVACPYCTFESIENKQLTEHINVAHPNQRVYFLFLEVNIEDAAKKYVNEPSVFKKAVQKQVSPKIQKPSLSQLLGGRKKKSPSKHLKSPEKLSKNVVSVMAGGLKKFRCRLCDYMALTRNSVGTHVFKVHENSGKGKTNSFTHITNVSDKLTCKFCEFTSSRSGELRIHYKEKHPQEVSDDSDEKRMEDGRAYTKSQKSEEKGGRKTEAKSHLQNGTVNIAPAQPSAKHRTDNQMKEKDVSKTAKKPEVILDRADCDEVVRDISESVKLKKRKEDRAEVTTDEPPAKKLKTSVTYHCPKCDFKDGKKENGVIHLKTEHGVTKLMQCVYCTASYVYEGKLKNHIKFLHKGKDVKFNMLPLESMLTESTKEKQSTSELCSDNSSSMCPASDCHKDSKKDQKSSHSLKSAKVDDRSKHTSLELSKSSENSVTKKKNHSTSKANLTKSLSEHSPGSSKRSGQGATVVHSLSKCASTDSSAQNTSRNLSKTAKKVPNQFSEGCQVKSTPKPPLKDSKNIPGKDTKSSSASPKYKNAFAKDGDETFMNCSKHSTTGSNSNQSKPSKSNQKNLGKDSLGEPQCSRGTDKSMSLPSYVPSSPDNSDDEKGDYYKYICVYCDFMKNKRSEMKIHLANHSIERLYKGSFPETEEAKVKIRNKVRDIMPICEERAKNKQEKVKEVISAEGATSISKEVKQKEEKLSPKKRTSEAVRKEQDCKQDSDSDSDAGSEIQIPKKVRRIKRVLSSSEDEDADVKSQLPKQQLTSPSGGQLTYCCHLCAYKGKLLYKFRSHLASHGTFKYLNADMSNESVLRCGFCDFLAADKDDFSQHVEKHLDGRIFKCGYCKYDTYHSKNMRSHLKNKHRHKPEKMIDLRSVLKERAQRPSQRPQLVNLDPELWLVNALKNREYRKLLDEAHCKTLDMPLYMVNIINKINEKKIVDVYPDTSDDEYGADHSDDDYTVNEDDDEEGEDDVILIQ